MNYLSKKGLFKSFLMFLHHSGISYMKLKLGSDPFDIACSWANFTYLTLIFLSL